MFKPHFQRTGDGHWAVIAPAAHPWSRGQNVTARTTSGHTRTVQVARISRPFATAKGPAVYLHPPRPERTYQTCDQCTIRTTQTYPTADSRNVAGNVCKPCNTLPPSELNFSHAQDAA